MQLLSVSVFHSLTVCLLYKRSDSVPQKVHWCNVMQIVAVCCGVLQCAGGAFFSFVQCLSVSVLQCFSVSVLQCFSVSVLQRFSVLVFQCCSVSVF